MTPEQREKIESLCLQALKKDGDERAAFLDAACGADVEMRREVDSRLAGEGDLVAFLDRPAGRTAAAPLAAGSRIGPYLIDSVIGTGGMGEVYKAQDPRLHRPVAIKAIRDAIDLEAHALRRLRAEARAAASVDHPYICKIYELLDEDALTFIVMEFVEGETLASVLARGVPPLKTTLHYASEIAEGLSAVHRHGLIHRDVKPSNVMVTPHGHVKLLDFGIARLNSGASATTRSSLTAPHTVVGTPLYMAPEQAFGHPVTPRADLFSLGVVLFECLTGELPFQAPTRDAYVEAVLAGHVRPLRELAPSTPENVRTLVENCLQVDPARRPEAAAVVAAELQRGAELLSSHSAAAAIPRPAPLRRAVPVLLAVIAVAGAVTAYRYSSRQPVTEPVHGSFLPVITEGGFDSDARLSPDATWMAYLSDREGPSKLFVQRMDSAQPLPAVDLPPDSVESYAWSPDGGRLACVVHRKNSRLLEIVPAFERAAPLKSIPLTPTPHAVRVARWVGDRVFLDVDLSTEGRHLWNVTLTEGRVNDVTPPAPEGLSYRSFDVAPNGEEVVFCADDTRYDLWVTRLGSKTAPTRLTDDDFVDRHPIWIGDTGRVAFQSTRGGDLDLWQMEVQSPHPVPLVQSPLDTEVPTDAAANGSMILFDRRREIVELFAVDAASRRSQSLTENALGDFWPSVSADGRTLAFQRRRATVTEGFSFLDTSIFVRPFEGHVDEPVRRVADGFGIRLSSDGTYVAYLQRSTDPALKDPTQNLLQVVNSSSGARRTLSRTAPMLDMPNIPGARVDVAAQNLQWANASNDLYFVTVADSLRQVSRVQVPDGDAEVVVSGSSWSTGGAPLPRRPIAPGVRDLRLSSDDRRLAYLTWWLPGVHQLRLLDLQTGRDELLHEAKGLAPNLYLRGWTRRDRGLLLLQPTANGDGTSRIELMEIGLDGTTRPVGTVPAGYPWTARLDPAGTRLFVTAAEQRVHNIYVVELPNGRPHAITDNQRRDVTFSGLTPLANGTVVYSRPRSMHDIYKLVTPAR